MARIRAYHGTDDASDFEAFDTGRRKDGLPYLTNSAAWAGNFGKRVRPADVEISNPYVINGEHSGRHLTWSKKDIRDLQRDGHDGIIIRHPDGDVISPFSAKQIKFLDVGDSPIMKSQSNSRGINDGQVHHCLDMKGKPLRGHCGADHGSFTEDVSTLFAHPRACKTCKRYYTEAAEHEVAHANRKSARAESGE